MPVNHLFNLPQPALAFLICTRNYDSEHLPMESGDSAEVEDAILPEKSKGIAEDFLFPLRRRVCRIEHDCGPGLEEPDGNSFSRVAFEELVSYVRSYYAINPALENCGRLPPPIGVNDDNAVRRANLPSM